jgi:hypothetical protein
MAVAFHSAARLSGVEGGGPDPALEPLPLLQLQQKTASKMGTATKTDENRLEAIAQSFHLWGESASQARRRAGRRIMPSIILKDIFPLYWVDTVFAVLKRCMTAL